jgi:hypothetical protein
MGAPWPGAWTLAGVAVTAAATFVLQRDGRNAKPRAA